MIVSASRVLPAAPPVVWSHLVRWEGQSRWMVDAASVRVVSAERSGPGVRIAVRTKVLGLSLFTEVLEVTLWEPPWRLEIAHGGLLRGRGRWRLEDLRGRTWFTWVEDVRLPAPVIGGIALLLYRPVMRRLMSASLARLARLVAVAPVRR